MSKKILQRRQQYEARLGHFLAQHPLALACARAMLKKARAYIYIRTQRVSQTPIEHRAEISRSLLACGHPLDEIFAGRVGKSPPRILRVFEGHGNLRELMVHLWLFANRFFCFDLVGERRLPGALAMAGKVGFDVAEIQRALDTAIAFKQAQGGEWNSTNPLDTLDATDDFIKMPWHPIRQAQEVTRVENTAQKNGAGWSTLTRGRFEADGGVFSSMENTLRSPLGEEYVPWLDARRYWLPNENAPFVQHARRNHLPVSTGLSGMTMQIMQTARMLGVGPASHVRLACLGYLLSTGAHTFHEIMATAKPFDCPYPCEGDYAQLPPLTRNEITEACGEIAPALA